MLILCREGILNFICSGVCLMIFLFFCCDFNWIGIELIISIELIIIDGLFRLLVYYDIYSINMDLSFLRDIWIIDGLKENGYNL